VHVSVHMHTHSYTHMCTHIHTFMHISTHTHAHAQTRPTPACTTFPSQLPRGGGGGGVLRLPLASPTQQGRNPSSVGSGGLQLNGEGPRAPGPPAPLVARSHNTPLLAPLTANRTLRMGGGRKKALLLGQSSGQ